MSNFLDFHILLQPITTIPGIGSSFGKYLINLLGANKIFDLCLHTPSKVESITCNPPLSTIKTNDLVILLGKIEAHYEPQKPKQPFKIICHNNYGYFTLVFFKIFPSQLKQLAIGNQVAVLGYAKQIFGNIEIHHPLNIANKIELLPKINLTYPLVAGINNKFIATKIKQVLLKLPLDCGEWQPQQLLQKHHWQGFFASIKALHQPIMQSQIDNDFSPARRRLACDELLAWQIATIMSQQKLVVANKNITNSKPDLLNNFMQSLPFNLTSGQLSACKQICNDILASSPMFRLLQGDVGSGKTIVAIVASLQAISCGRQVAVLVPTTILAIQHFKYFSMLLKPFNINISLLISDTKKKERIQLLQQLNSGSTNIIIGTHALLENNIVFANLGLVVIDEQHRFGVLQRLQMQEKGQNPDLLLLSATPIPRSLMMAIYGDTAITILNEKPKNRKEITTLLMSKQKIPQLMQSLTKFLNNQQKAYWICPAIDDSCNDDDNNNQLTSLQQRYQELSTIIDAKHLAILHGKMKDKEKDEIMLDFANPASEARIMIATTVIEVGIDVSTATLIIIEDAENFGLAQLHQLRGRVGRSDLPSFCILLYRNKATHRLQILKESSDGFFIAEQDLKIRGSGEIISTKQSGFPEFKIANLALDYDLLADCNRQASAMVNSNNIYNDILLKLFDYQDCLKNSKG